MFDLRCSCVTYYLFEDGAKSRSIIMYDPFL